MNAKTKIGIVAGIIGVVLFGIFLYVGFRSQMAIGFTSSQSDCQSRVQSWCVDGYSCTACSQQTLSYTVNFASGSTNKVWTADCQYGSTPSDSLHTACQLSPVSKVRTACYNGDVYWYNSAGVRETLKTDCSAGCEQYSLDEARCKAVPIVQEPTTLTTTVKSTYCSDTNTLCKNGAFDPACTGGTKVSCPAGCDLLKKECKALSCTNDCTTVGVGECTSPNAFKTCTQQSSGCLKWSEPAFCPSGNVCSNGKCVVSTTPINYPVCSADGKMLCTSNAQIFNGEIIGCTGTACANGCSSGKCIVTTTPVPAPTCTTSRTCISDYKYERVYSDCSEKIVTCPSGEECSNGSCSVVPLPDAETPVDLCAGVSCQDKCDSSLTLQKNGRCELGSCVYETISFNDPSCTSNDITGGVTDEVKSEGLSPIWLIVAVIFMVAMYVLVFGGKKKRGKR